MEHVAKDQHGQTYWLGKYPRKDLLKTFDRKHAEKMYRDTPDGPQHIGYVVAGIWLRVWKLSEISKAGQI